MKRMILVLMSVFCCVPVWAQQNFTTDDIANQALSHEGEVVGSCKVFAQMVIRELGVTLGSGYRDCYEKIGVEITSINDVVRGDVIQVSYDINEWNEDHVHTAIVLENNGDGTFDVVHSNYDVVNTVTTHDNWDPVAWASRWSGWTAHFYRLGRLVTAQYPTASQFQSSWNELVHGFAVTPDYQWGNLLRQDFQYTVMTYNASNGSVVVDGTNWICPGMTQSGWDWSVTPYFVKAYNDHGRANAFGNAYSDAGNPIYAHLWGEYWIQNWNGGSLGECAIMFDPTLPANKRQAAPIHGELWGWFRYNGGPYYVLSNGAYLGCPVAPEEYANLGVNFDVIQLTSNGYLYWDESTVTAYPRSTVEISIIPGDGQTLVLWVTVLSPTSVYLSNNEITGAVRYWYYRNGQFIANDLNFEYTDTGLAPNTSYSYQALAVDAGGTILAESAIVTVTTPAESAPEGLNLTLLAHSTSIDVSWPLVNQANSYQVFLNGNYHGSTSSWSYAITGLATSVTYT